MLEEKLFRYEGYHSGVRGGARRGGGACGTSSRQETSSYPAGMLLSEPEAWVKTVLEV